MKVMKWVLLFAVILAIVCAVVSITSQKETDAYIVSVDAFIAEVER